LAATETSVSASPSNPASSRSRNHQPIPPSIAAFAKAFNSSVSPCSPNIRFIPANGLIRLPLNAIDFDRQPNEPRKAGPMIAAASVTANRTPSGNNMG
jgi:hypothetical protein